MLLNTNDINMILIKPNKYYIHFMIKKNDGFAWALGGFGFGYISSIYDNIEVCETKHPVDYKILTEWINNKL
jgi:hypothetical protein